MITPYSCTVIAPQKEWDELRAFLRARDYEIGDGVPMSADGKEPITHRGAHMWMADYQTGWLGEMPQPQLCSVSKYSLDTPRQHFGRIALTVKVQQILVID